MTAAAMTAAAAAAAAAPTMAPVVPTRTTRDRHTPCQTQGGLEAMDFTFLEGYPAPGKVSGLCLGGKALPSPDAEPIEMLLVHTTAILGEPPSLPPPPIAVMSRYLYRTPPSSPTISPLHLELPQRRRAGQPHPRRDAARFSHTTTPLATPHTQGAICSSGRPS